MHPREMGPFHVGVAIAIGLFVTLAILLAIAVWNNHWMVWDTARFCGSYADFDGEVVAPVCLSVLEYMQLSLGHPPHIGPAVVAGLASALAYLSLISR